MNQRTTLLLTSLLLLTLLAGCSSRPEVEATATPTKTPTVAAAEAAAPATEETQPTSTPVPPPPTNTPEPVADEPGSSLQARITTSELNVRSGPSTEFDIVRSIGQDQSFEIVGRSENGEWAQIAENGSVIGWVALRFLQVDGDVNTLPSVAASAPTGGGNAQPAESSTQPVNSANFLPATMTSPDYGAQAFLWWRPEVADRDLELMQEGGFNWVKQSFAWETIAGAGPGIYDWSIADRVVAQVNGAGLKLLARLSSDPELQGFWAGKPPGNADAFADFAFAIASRYNCQPGSMGCIQAYQVWNEPNLGREWGGNRPNPAEYATFLRTAYSAIKRGNPQALVISAGMAPTGDNSAIAMPDDVFYTQMYEAMGGNSNGYFDALGVHGAGFAAPPELDPATAAADSQYGGYRFFAFRHVEDIRAIMVRFGDTNKKIVILEFGWTFDPVNAAYAWHGANAGIDQFVQADYLKRAYQYAAENWQPWIGLMSVLTMPNLDWLNDGNPQDEEQYWWAIMEPSPVNTLNFRAAYIVLCDYFNSLNGQPCKYDPARQ